MGALHERENEVVTTWRQVGVAAGAIAPFLVAFALSFVRSSLPNSTSALVLMAFVVGIASFAGRIAGIVASASAAAFFDFFLTRPFDEFAIARTSEAETACAIVIIGVLVTEVSVKARERYAIALAEGTHLAFLRECAELVATGASAEDVLSAATGALSEVLGLENCRYEQGTPREGRWQLGRNAEIERGGERYDAASRGLPAEGADLPVSNRGRVVGHFVLRQAAPCHLTIEARVTAVALADEVGSALEPKLQLF